MSATKISDCQLISLWLKVVFNIYLWIQGENICQEVLSIYISHALFFSMYHYYRLWVDEQVSWTSNIYWSVVWFLFSWKIMSISTIENIWYIAIYFFCSRWDKHFSWHVPMRKQHFKTLFRYSVLGQVCFTFVCYDAKYPLLQRQCFTKIVIIIVVNAVSVIIGNCSSAEVIGNCSYAWYI